MGVTLSLPHFFPFHDNYIKTLEVTYCQSMGPGKRQLDA